jgi:oligopeptide/dipeptide ABC transporter ATP-binding protein
MYAGEIAETANVPTFFAGAAHPYSRHMIKAATAARDTSQLEATVAGGAAPGLATGCAYAPRCPVALARCHSERPRLEALIAGHSASCFRKAEVAAGRIAL